MPRSTVTERFTRKLVALPSGCIEWVGCLDRGGYGYIGRDSKKISTHRLAWEIANGPIPDGLYVCHSCDNPKCCNVDHLWLGTNAENQADSRAKGRHVNTSKTHCVNGHPFNEANTYRWRSRRFCKVCNRNLQHRKILQRVATP